MSADEPPHEAGSRVCEPSGGQLSADAPMGREAARLAFVAALAAITGGILSGSQLSTWKVVIVILAVLIGAFLTLFPGAPTWQKVLIVLVLPGISIAGYFIGNALRYHPRPPPPSARVLTRLINNEARAAMTHHPGDVRRIYAANAVIIDSACVTGGHQHSWPGIAKILQRYERLRKFPFLRHFVVQVRWMPDGPNASRAIVTTDTIARIAAFVKSHGEQFVYGGEQWTFARTGKKWLVTRLVYDRCL